MNTELLHMGLQVDLHQTQLRTWLLRIARFYAHVESLADSFVIDFHTDAHWSKLPPCWRNYLEELSPAELGVWMLGGTGSRNICPLGLLAFRNLTQDLSLNREAVPLHQLLDLLRTPRAANSAQSGQIDPELQKLLNRRVKLKKRHEIERMSALVTACAHRTGTKIVVDVGGGLGHLSRYLSTAEGLNLTCIDGEGEFADSARKLDTKLQNSRLGKKIDSNGPSYVSKRLTFDQRVDFHSEDTPESSTDYGLIGLHTCGDLGPLILTNFTGSKSPSARFVVQVGCCYMKMSPRAFPMSRYLQQGLRTPTLAFSYEALEVACHSIETYADKLRAGGAQVEALRIHNHRAVLEVLMRTKYPEMEPRIGMKSARGLNLAAGSFQEYVRTTTTGIGVEFSTKELHAVEGKLDDWWRVVCFYSLRLRLATVIETAVLLDRLLYLREEGCPSTLAAIFDPRISPRNYAIIGFKELTDLLR